MSVFQKIRGTSEPEFQVGLQGPQLQADLSQSQVAMNVVDAQDNLAVLRVADPVDGSDAANLDALEPLKARICKLERLLACVIGVLVETGFDLPDLAIEELSKLEDSAWLF
jgi:hypothetical protein